MTRRLSGWGHLIVDHFMIAEPFLCQTAILISLTGKEPVSVDTGILWGETAVTCQGSQAISKPRLRSGEDRLKVPHSQRFFACSLGLQIAHW
jgi:hypothetical protein